LSFSWLHFFVIVEDRLWFLFCTKAEAAFFGDGDELIGLATFCLGAVFFLPFDFVDFFVAGGVLSASSSSPNKSVAVPNKVRHSL
jgi:hypothetical protein